MNSNKECLKENPFKKLTKKGISFLLAFIIAFGTFITFTLTYSPLHKWLGIHNMLSAYAAEIVDTAGAIAVDEEAMKADDHTINLENKDGSNTMYLFSEPISFIDEDGNIRTKDISIKKANAKLKKKGYEYTNGANDYRINFSKNYKKGIQAEFDGASYSLVPQSIIKVDGEEAVAEYLGEKFEVFQYKNIYGNGTNLRFYPQLNGIKDEIVLDQNINKNTFTFELKTKNCTARLNEDGTISLMNKDGAAIQTFAAPFAYDSEYIEGDRDQHYVDCSYSLENKNKHTYLMSITVPEEWLNSETTKYPVTIDPTTGHISMSQDAGVYKKYKNQNFGNDQNCGFGYSDDYDKGRVYTQFTIPAAIKNGATIDSAYLWERETTGRTTSTEVIGYMVKESWTEGGVVWAAKPSYNADYASNKRTINSKSKDNSNSPYWYKFNIKSIVNQWVNGGKPNYGITFRSDEEDNLNKNWRTFASRSHSTSSYRPYAVISYTNDKIAPTFGVVKNPGGWTNQDVTFTIVNATDNIALDAKPYGFNKPNCVHGDENNYDWQSSPSKVYSTHETVYFAVRDHAGNISRYSEQTWIDKSKPVITSAVLTTPNGTVLPSGTWTNQNVTITANGSDAAPANGYGQAGLSGTWSFSETGAYMPQNTNTKTYTRSADVNVAVLDRAGNWSNNVRLSVRIDKTAPVINDISVKYNKSTKNYDVTVAASDTESGIAAYSTDAGQTWSANPKFENISYIGLINFAVRDNAGNIAHYQENRPYEAPIMYQDGKYVKIISGDPLSSRIWYRTDSGAFSEYDEPIELADNVETTVEAALHGTNAFATETFIYSPSDAVMPYEEDITDVTIDNNDTTFTVDRYYDSISDEWFFSTESRVREIKKDYVYSVKMPYGEELIFALDEDGKLVNEEEEYTLTTEYSNSQFVVDCDGELYGYDMASGRLKFVFYQNHAVNFEYANGKLVNIYIQEGGERRNWAVEERADGKLSSIANPLGEKIIYQYNSNNQLIKAYYDKTTLQTKPQNDIIIGEYSYNSDDKLSVNNKTQIEYINNNIKKITKPNGECTEYSYSKYFNDYGINPVPAEENFKVIEEKDKTGIRVYDYSLDLLLEIKGTYAVAYTYQNDDVVVHEYQMVDGAYVELPAEPEEPDNTSEPVYTYFDGTEIVQTETITEIVDGKTITTIITYDRQSRIISERVLQDSIQISLTEYFYYGDTATKQRAVTTKTKNGKTVVTTNYDEQERETSVIIVQGDAENRTEYKYDGFGNIWKIISTIKENGLLKSRTVEEREYDFLNRCIKSTLTYAPEKSVITEYIYNANDNVIRQKVTEGDKIEITRIIYDEYGRVVQEIEPRDYTAADDGIVVTINAENGKTIISGNDSYANPNVGHRYEYNNNDQLTKEINRLDVTTKYTYYDTGEKKTETFDIYKYEYYKHGGTENIYVKGVDETQKRLYAHYEYDKFNRNIEIQYGNDQTVYYEYDNDGNLVAQKYKESPESSEVTQFTYTYDENGLATKYDYAMEQRTKYGENGKVSIYDVKNRGEENETETLYYEYYETAGEVNAATGEQTSQSIKKFGNKTLKIAHNAEGNTYSFNEQNLFTTESTRDEQGRIATETVKKPNGDIIVKNEYTYNDNDQVATMTVTKADGVEIIYTYIYDSEGRITTYTQNNTGKTNGELEQRYAYDEKGQLVRYDEIHSSSWNNTFVYEYNNRGNRTTKIKYSNVADIEDLEGQQSYSVYDGDKFKYEDGIWLDRLTGDFKLNSYITSNEDGNTQHIGACKYHWQNGRQLEKVTYSSQDRVWAQFTYDENGIKTSTENKYNQDRITFTNENGVMTSYKQVNKNGETVDDIIILRDDNDQPIAAIHNGTTYYYIRNMQGDIVSITDETGTEIISYTYDPWGEWNADGYGSCRFSVANMLRYRGYYYDEHMLNGYYLQSRYYLDEYGRFLNADIPDMARDHKEDINGMNLFAYCNNDPINKVDPTGYWVETFIDVVSIGWSLYDFASSPSWLDFAFLVWDVGAAFIPFAPGSYTVKAGKVVTRGGKAVINVASKADELKDANNLILGSYKGLRKIYKGQKGIEVHHIIEKRFRKLFKPHHNDFLSVPLGKEVHKKITKRWRKQYKYGTNYRNITKSDMKKAIKNVYYDMPALKKQALDWLERNWKGAN